MIGEHCLPIKNLSRLRDENVCGEDESKKLACLGPIEVRFLAECNRRRWF